MKIKSKHLWHFSTTFQCSFLPTANRNICEKYCLVLQYEDETGHTCDCKTQSADNPIPYTAVVRSGSRLYKRQMCRSQTLFSTTHSPGSPGSLPTSRPWPSSHWDRSPISSSWYNHTFSTVQTSAAHLTSAACATMTAETHPLRQQTGRYWTDSRRTYVSPPSVE